MRGLRLYDALQDRAEGCSAVPSIKVVPDGKHVDFYIYDSPEDAGPVTLTWQAVRVLCAYLRGCTEPLPEA